MPGQDLEIRPGVVIPETELHETASRSSGPGGQHVNTSSTRVTLRWNALASAVLGPVRRARLRQRLAGRLTRAGELVVHAGRHRSRARNRELARQRLAELVRSGIAAPSVRRATRPSRSSRERRLRQKRRRSDLKRGRSRPAGDD